MAETLAELLVRISADSSAALNQIKQTDKEVQNLAKTSQDMSKQWTTMGKTFTVAGAAIIASVGLMEKSFISTGSELHDLNLKTNVSVRTLAGLKYAAEQGGASLGTIEMALRRTSMAITEAKENSDEQTKAFKRMGLSIDDLEGLSTEEQFLKIANAVAKIPDAMTRSATAISVFGRTGTEMLPMLASNFEETVQKGRELSGWTDEMADKADALGDSFGTLKTASEGLFNQIGSALAPTIKGLADGLTSVTSALTNFAQEHPIATQGVTNFGLGLGESLASIGALILILPKATDLLKNFGLTWGKGIGLAALATAGFGLMNTGFSQLGANSDLATSRLKLNAEQLKFNAGEENTYYESMLQHAKNLRSYTENLGFFGMFMSEDDKTANLAQADALEKVATAALKVTSAKAALAEVNAGQLADAQKLIASWQYENSTAGQLGITMEDIYNHLLDLNFGTEVVTELFTKFGLETKNLDALLEASKITIFDVRDAYKELAEAALKSAAARRAEAMAAPGEPIPSDIAHQMSLRMGMFGAGIYSQSEIEHYFGGLKEAYPWMDITVPSFASGGTVPGELGQPQLILAHGGEQYLGVGNHSRENISIIVNAGLVTSERDLGKFLTKYINEWNKNTYTTKIS